MNKLQSLTRTALLAISTVASQGLFAQSSVLYDFNTAGQLAQVFNSSGPNASSVQESQTTGLANSGAITVSGGTNAVFSTKDAYSMGPVGSSYTFTSYVNSVGNNGYSGMGFTAASPASAGTTANVYRPSDGVGISVHGSGFIFHNGSTDISGNWNSASGNSLTAVTPSTCTEILNNTTTTCGSPDRWYKIVFKLVRAGATTFNMRVEVWPVDRVSGQDRYANATAIYEVNNFTNSALANAPQIFSYFNFSGDRVRVFDNYGVNLAGGASVIIAGYPVVLTSSATVNGSAVTVAGDVTSANGGTVTERGFVYGTSTNPTIANSKIAVGSGTGSFSGVTTSLAGGTYYFRAFATNGAGTSYGSEVVRTICVSPNVSFKLSAPNVTTSAIQGQTGSSTENFNSGSVGIIPNSGSFAIGSYVSINPGNIQKQADDVWGGSGSQYLGVHATNNQAGYVNITLTDPSRYVGFWWGAGDAQNSVTIYGDCGGNEVQLGQFTAQTVLNLLNGPTVTAVDGNSYPSSQYKRSNAANEAFAYINLELSDPNIYFTRIVVGGGGFEIDNITTSTVYGAATFTVPSVPTGLTATRSGTSASISFTPGSNGGTPITNYEYSLDNGQTWITLSPATATSPITISGLTAGQGYDVMIRAVNAIGTGTASATVTLPAASISAPAPLTFGRNVTNGSAGSFEISGFAPSDNLYLTLSLRNPPVGTTLNFSSIAGLTAAPGYVLAVGSGFTTISVTGNEADLNAALSSLKLSTGNEVGAIVIDASVTLNPSGYFYSPSNGHWYKPMTWPNNVSGGNSAYDQIKTLSSNETFKGQSGYLVTITSQSEQDFIQANVPGNNILIALTDKDVEGVWKWDAGPESGTIIRSGGQNIAGQYNIWCSNEPNDHSSGEDFAVTKWGGGACWNDYGPPASSFPASVSGYVIEFGTSASSVNQNWTGVYQASVQHTSGGLTVNSSSLTAFTGCTAEPSTSQSITVSGTNLQGPITVSAPTGFQVSLSQSNGFGSSVSISQTSGSVAQTAVFVRLSATSVGSHSGTVTIASTNTVTQTVAVSGSVTQSADLSISNSLCGSNQ